jgi:hypothetical protein
MHGECPCIECCSAQQVGRNRYASTWLNGGYDADLPIFGVEGGVERYARFKCVRDGDQVERFSCKDFWVCENLGNFC